MDLKEPLKLLGDDITKKIIEVLLKKDKKVTGKLVSSINSRVLTLVNDISYQLQVLDDSGYFTDVDLGRKPGKFPPLKKIQQWCKIRGIDLKYAYPIRLKIGSFGTDPNYIFDDAIKQVNLKTFEDSVEKIVFDQVTEQIMQVYRQKEKL